MHLRKAFELAGSKKSCTLPHNKAAPVDVSPLQCEGTLTLLGALLLVQERFPGLSVQACSAGGFCDGAAVLRPIKHLSRGPRKQLPSGGKFGSFPT